MNFVAVKLLRLVWNLIKLELSFYFRIKPTTTKVHLRTLLHNKKGYMNIAINAQF